MTRPREKINPHKLISIDSARGLPTLHITLLLFMAYHKKKEIFIDWNGTHSNAKTIKEPP